MSAPTSSTRLGRSALLAVLLCPAVVWGQAAPPPAATSATSEPWPAFLADSTLSLPALERSVLERNTTLAALRAVRAEAEAHAVREGSLGDPTVHAWIAPQSVVGRYRDTAEPGWGVALEQPLGLFGQRGAERDEARSERDATVGDLSAARLDLLRDTRRAYYEDVHWGNVEETTAEVLALVRRVRQSALARYAAGSVGQADVLQADVEIATLEHESVSAARNRRVVEARLRSLLHLPPTQLLPPPPSMLEAPAADHAGTALAARQAATWPELAAAEARIHARRAGLDRAGRERYPGTALTAAYDAAMEHQEWRAQVGVQITLPLNTGRVSADEDEARARLDRAVAERDAQRDELERRLAEAVTQFEESLHELQILRDQLVPSTQRAVAAARAGYESGTADFGALLLALRDHRRARLEYHRTITTALDAAAELERAVGGPAEPAEGGAR